MMKTEVLEIAVTIQLLTTLVNLDSSKILISISICLLLIWTTKVINYYFLVFFLIKRSSAWLRNPRFEDIKEEWIRLKVVESCKFRNFFVVRSFFIIITGLYTLW